MFGYVKPCKPELKVKEFDTFKAIYCGLCKQLSKTYGPLASLTLSYDFAFVAALSLGLSDQCGGFRKCRCVANPLKRKACAIPSEDLNFCASTAMLMVYYKIKDDLQDSRFWGKLRSLFLLPLAAAARKKARRLYPETDQVLSEVWVRQAVVEQESYPSIDRAADPTASALGKICETLSTDTRQKAILSRFGYLTGRYVYFADALDDLEEDQKRGGYNPFLVRFSDRQASLQEIRDYAVGVLNLTIGELAAAYELLDLKRYKTILDNIIYLGLQQEIQVILQKGSHSNRKKGARQQTGVWSDHE